MNQVISLGERLREERARLGYSQPAFAALVGASKHTVLNWEKGLGGAPDARALGIWSEHGLDVTYVINGERSIRKANTLYEVNLLMQAIDLATADSDVGRSVHEAYNALYAEALAKGSQPGQPISKEEQVLLDGYRLANADGKRLFLRQAEMEIERKALMDQAQKSQSYSGISITGDGNTIGSGNQSGPIKKTTKKAAKKS